MSVRSQALCAKLCNRRKVFVTEFFKKYLNSYKPHHFYIPNIEPKSKNLNNWTYTAWEIFYRILLHRITIQKQTITEEKINRADICDSPVIYFLSPFEHEKKFKLYILCVKYNACSMITAKIKWRGYTFLIILFVYHFLFSVQNIRRSLSFISDNDNSPFTLFFLSYLCHSCKWWYLQLKFWRKVIKHRE